MKRTSWAGSGPGRDRIARGAGKERRRVAPARLAQPVRVEAGMPERRGLAVFAADAVRHRRRMGGRGPGERARRAASEGERDAGQEPAPGALPVQPVEPVGELAVGRDPRGVPRAAARHEIAAEEQGGEVLARQAGARPPGAGEAQVRRGAGPVGDVVGRRRACRRSARWRAIRSGCDQSSASCTVTNSPRASASARFRAP